MSYRNLALDTGLSSSTMVYINHDIEMNDLFYGKVNLIHLGSKCGKLYQVICWGTSFSSGLGLDFNAINSWILCPYILFGLWRCCFAHCSLTVSLSRSTIDSICDNEKIRCNKMLLTSNNKGYCLRDLLI